MYIKWNGPYDPASGSKYNIDFFQIERIKISFDGGKTSMNFAEAALLIQGSACIYSKKVFHNELYSYM